MGEGLAPSAAVLENPLNGAGVASSTTALHALVTTRVGFGLVVDLGSVLLYHERHASFR
jgi:hypothetical protein